MFIELWRRHLAPKGSYLDQRNEYNKPAMVSSRKPKYRVIPKRRERTRAIPTNIPSRHQRRKRNRQKFSALISPTTITSTMAPYLTAMPGYCGFLKLPQELRDIIYDLVIDDQWSVAEGPNIFVWDSRRAEHSSPDSWIWYQYRLPTIKTAGLLNTSRQVRQETIKSIISRNESTDRGICYKLCLTGLGNSLVPTWFTIPAPLDYIQSVEIDMEMLILEGSEWSCVWDTRYPGQLPQCLLQMLRRFLDYGPRFKACSSSRTSIDQTRKPLRLDTLTINLHPAAMRLGVDSATGRSSLQQRSPFIHPTQDPTNDAHHNLGRWMKRLAESGLLLGKIRRLRLWYQDALQEWEVTGQAKLTESIKECALFGWGPVLGITQKALHGGQIDYSEDLDCLPLTAEQVHWHEENANCSEEICSMPQFSGQPHWRWLYRAT